MIYDFIMVVSPFKISSVKCLLTEIIRVTRLISISWHKLHHECMSMWQYSYLSEMEEQWFKFRKVTISEIHRTCKICLWNRSRLTAHILCSVSLNVRAPSPLLVSISAMWGKWAFITRKFILENVSNTFSDFSITCRWDMAVSICGSQHLSGKLGELNDCVQPWLEEIYTPQKIIFNKKAWNLN